jgi:hypothetical protein
MVPSKCLSQLSVQTGRRHHGTLSVQNAACFKQWASRPRQCLPCFLPGLFVCPRSLSSPKIPHTGCTPHTMSILPHTERTRKHTHCVPLAAPRFRQLHAREYDVIPSSLLLAKTRQADLPLSCCLPPWSQGMCTTAATDRHCSVPLRCDRRKDGFWVILVVYRYPITHLINSQVQYTAESYSELKIPPLGLTSLPAKSRCIQLVTRGAYNTSEPHGFTRLTRCFL